MGQLSPYREVVQEFGRERRVELGGGQVELGDIGTLLLLGVGGLDLDSSRLAMVTVRDQKVPRQGRARGRQPSNGA